MGLDVYLYHCSNRPAAKAAEDAANEAAEDLWQEICCNNGTEEWDKVKESDKDRRYKVYKAKKKAIESTFGVVDGEHKDNTKIKNNSALYPDHMFKIGYFRSSYNEGGIDRIMRNLGLPTLSNLFRVTDGEYEFTPDWKTSLTRTVDAITRYTAHLNGKSGDLAVTKVVGNMFSDPTEWPSSEAAALKIVERELEKYDPSKKDDFSTGNYSNRDGEFIFGDPLEVVAMIPGTRESIMAKLHSQSSMEAVTYIVYRKKRETGEKDWYLKALEIVKETIEWVLGQSDPENYYFHWSG
jgi:hypothetical protein